MVNYDEDFVFFLSIFKAFLSFRAGERAREQKTARCQSRCGLNAVSHATAAGEETTFGWPNVGRRR